MLKLVGLALAGTLLIGCSGNSSSTRTVDKEVITNLGGRVDSSITGARVTAVEINAEGAPVRIFDDAGNKVFDGSYDISDDAGDFEVILDDVLVGRSMMFIATNDSGNVGFRCESVGGCSGVAYKGYVSIPEDLDIRAGVSEVADSMTVNVNWLTDLASSLARTVYIDAFKNIDGSTDDRADIDAAILAQIETAKTGVYNEYTIELANLHISKMFGLSDVIFVKPVGPSQVTLDQNLSSTQLQESIYMGALVGALPLIARDKSISYSSALTEITELLIQRKGQLLQKDTSGNEIALADIYSKAAGLLEENINYLKTAGARLPPEAEAALSKLKAVLNGLTDGAETNVVVDVPAELAGWTTNIGKSKEFIADLTEAIKNFWGEDPSKSSFVDPAHARRLDAYYAAHENLYKDVAPGMYEAFQDILLAAKHLSVCKNGGSCTPDDNFVINASESTVTINGSLTITLVPVGESAPYTEFDLNISDGSLTKNGTEYLWSKGFISDFSREEQPYIRLVFDDESSTLPDLNSVEPLQITVVWPSVRFSGNFTGPGSDSGDHAIDLLFETNLYAVKDPLNNDPNTEVRYNPATLVFWVRSVSGDGSYFDLSTEALENAAPINNTAFQSELLTSFPLQYYPNQKWPSSAEFFKSRTDSPATILNMVSLYVGKETLEDGTVVDVFDQQLIGETSVIRIRVYPYDASTDATKSQGCIVPTLGGEASECSAITLLAGERTLPDLLAANFKEGILSTYAVRANGEYTIDLNVGENRTYNIIVDGEFNSMPAGTYGPYTGTFSKSFQLGIERLNVTANSQMVKDGEYVPVALEAALQRSTGDIFSASLAYAYASQYDIANVDIPVGQEAQGFVLEYDVSLEDSVDGSGNFVTNEIELGNVIIYRTGVVLSGNEETVGASIVSRVEYPQGDQELACGVNDRDKLSSAGGCDAVAYLTFRGALVATIREERSNVFVARFVDGSWMVLGE